MKAEKNSKLEKGLVREFIDINEVNEKLKYNDVKVMLDAESLYRGQLFRLAQKVLKIKAKQKVVLLAGPSCAGKTTTAHLLKEIFENRRKKAIIVSMDDFFVNREETPLLPNGMKDFDGLGAVNLEQMDRCFSELFKEGKADFPRFDFITGLNLENEYHLKYDKDTIIIFEGLHVLNPELIKHLGGATCYKVYVSTLKGFKLSEFSKIGTRQLRLIRRMIRDVRRRGKSPEFTMDTWKNVCDSEDTYISPYKNDADFYINTTHEFELALYKNEFFEIVMKHRQVTNQLNFLPIFEESVSLDKRLLPETSLMWDFIDKPGEEVDD